MFFKSKAIALTQLQSFDEPKYLHQTCIRKDEQILFFEDLASAVEAHDPFFIWRSHFHVPIYLDTMDLLMATSHDIIEGVRAIKEHSDCNTFEIETYAWGVLPQQLRVSDLAQGIAAELKWFKETFSESV